jgi:hypothetical protein
MSLFIQGMRRSGTTIVYDALLEDPGLRCFYEPFTSSKAAVGGGSGLRGEDLFAEVRALREEFRRTRRPDLDPELLNWGAPRAPELELEPDLPDFCREYLGFLLEQGDAVVTKHVRMYRKVPVLAELDPGGALLHVVRDPRALATSYLLGRDRRRAHLFPDADAFFAHRSKRSMWATRQLADLLTELPEFGHLRGCGDVDRVLAVWRFTFESTRRDGLACFGARYRLLRHEDVRADPSAAIASAYDLLGRRPPPGVDAWARRAVRGAAQEILAADDPRWGEAMARVGLEPALRDAGYGELVPAA